MISRRKAIKNVGLVAAGSILLPKSTDANKLIKKDNVFSYCLNTSTISGQKTGFLKEFEITAKAGYDGVEIWINALKEYLANGGDLKDLKKFVDDLGLKIENAIGFAQWIVDDPIIRKAGMEQLKEEMDLLAQIGCRRIAAPPAGATGKPLIDLFEAGKRYRDILEIGEKSGVTPQLEIWGPSANLNHISQAMFVASAANHPKACILPDVYHMFRGGSGYNSLKLLSGASIEMFHFNDFVADIPREKQKDSDRVYPGDGDAPIVQIVADLYKTGGKKILSLELFNPEYWKEDALQVAKTGLNRMKQVVEKGLGTIMD